MPDPGRFVLITRPEPGAGATAAGVAALGYRPVVAPLLEIHRTASRLPMPSQLQAILAASGYAVDWLPDSHREVPLLAVGDATASRARAAGFTQVLSAQGDAMALAELAAAHCDPAGLPLLLAAGRGQGDSLAADIRGRGFRIHRRVVYAAIPVAELPQPALDALQGPGLHAVMFFSAATARHFVRLMVGARLCDAVREVAALAIGRPAAVAIESLPWRRLSVAARPTQDAMLALL